MRRRLAAATAVLAAVLSGCTQAVSGRPVTAPPPPAGFPATTDRLADLLGKGAASIRFAHLSLSVAVAGRAITAEGDETVAGGRVVDVSITETIPDFGALNLVISHDRYYAQLPRSRRVSAKPWVLVRPTSRSSVVRQLYAALTASQRSSSLDTGAVFVRAATRLRFLGLQTLDGTATGHYALSVEVARLPADYPGKSTLTTAGVARIPVEVWVDAQGRPRLITEQLSAAGTATHTEVRLRDFDVPVSIQAPPPGQVSTE